MDIEQKAARAKRLRDDEYFQSLITEVRENAVKAFLTSALTDDKARFEARAIIAGIEQVEALLQGEIDAETKQKGRHRGSD